MHKLNANNQFLKCSNDPQMHLSRMKSVKLTLFCVPSAFRLDFGKKGAMSLKIGCNLQMNFLHARLLHKSICPDSDSAHLSDPIHIPDFFTRQCFPFSQREKSKISMFSGATSVTDWPPFFLPPTSCQVTNWNKVTLERACAFSRIKGILLR